MKIIEGLKLKKRLVRKAKDIQDKIKANCVRMSNETPQYGKSSPAKSAAGFSRTATSSKRSAS
jgi:hypothetical protein